MISTNKIQNGINTKQLRATIKDIQQRPELGEFKFRVKNNWISGGHSVSSIKSYFGIGKELRTREETFTAESDQPSVLLGEDHAPSPVEMLLHALVSSLTATLITHATKQGLTIQSMASSIDGCLDLQGFLGLDTEVRKGYKCLNIAFKVKSNATAEQLQQLTLFSPVLDAIINPTPVNITFKSEQLNQ